MATLDYTRGVTIQPIAGNPQWFGAYVDCTDATGKAYDQGATGAADVLKVFSVPAGTFVDKAVCIVRVAEGGTQIADIGDGDDADGYMNDTDLNATAGTADFSDTTDDAFAEAGGKYYSSADTIDVTLITNGMNTGKFEVWIHASYFGPLQVGH